MSVFNTNNADMPASPVPEKVGQRFTDRKCRSSIDESGLTKREELAARAMQGLLASFGEHDVTEADEIASDAVLFADALLAELEKHQ